MACCPWLFIEYIYLYSFIAWNWNLYRRIEKARNKRESERSHVRSFRNSSFFNFYLIFKLLKVRDTCFVVTIDDSIQFIDVWIDSYLIRLDFLVCFLCTMYTVGDNWKAKNVSASESINVLLININPLNFVNNSSDWAMRSILFGVHFLHLFGYIQKVHKSR